MRARFAAAWAIGLLLAGAGCAWGPGGSFSEIRGGSLWIKLNTRPGRLDPAGRWLTNNGYALTFDGGGLAASAATIALVGTTGGGTAGAFDPAKPPAGYTLCHADHCHRADGALISYAEVEADLIRKAGGAATESVANLLWDFKGALLKPNVPVERPLERCSPGCLLARGTLAGADLSMQSLAASGTVEALPGAPALPGGTRTWTLTLSGLEALKGNTVQRIDRDAPAVFGAGGALVITDRLFDDLSWAGFGSPDPLSLESSASAASTLKANFAKSKWTPGLEPRL